MIRASALAAAAFLTLGLAHLPAAAAPNPCAMKANPCAMEANPCQPGAGVSGARTTKNKRPIVAWIHADWCPSCKRIQPSIEALKTHYGADVEFLTLDVTDAKHATRARKLARTKGLAAFFARYQSQTSTVAIFPARSARESRILVGEADQGAYAAILDPLVDKGKARGR